MPFVSQAQRGLFYHKMKEGEISPEVVKHFEDATPRGKKLPYHVEKKAFWVGFFKQAELRDSVQLEPHQTRAGDRLKKKRGVLVYHGLGSGKTLTSLAATQGTNTDVIVPAALRQNYLKETKLHTKNHRPNVMSYEKALKTPLKGKALVIDEAHSLGQVDSKRSQHMVDQAKRYDSRMLLTGTPIRNRPAELGPLLSMVRGDQQIPVQPDKFDEKFVQEVKTNPGLWARIAHGAKSGVTYRMKNQKLFHDLVDGYVDFHQPSKENYPSMSHEVVEAPMNHEQLQYYRFVLGKAGPALRWKIRHGLPPSKTEAKQLNSFLSGARQVSNSPQAFGGGHGTKIPMAFERATEKMEKDKNFKALVYSNYLDAGVRPYADMLEQRGIPYGVFDGSLSDTKRKELVDAYNTGKIKFLLISGAGSQGLDLKGTKLVQLLEPHWNNPRLEQAVGRAARFKSHAHLPKEERHVHVERYHSTVPPSWLQRMMGKKDMSVDQYLDKLSKEKENLNNQFLDVLKEAGSKDE